MDEIHFVSAKKKSQFKVKTQIRTFICNIRVVGEEVDKLLKEMQFNLSFTLSYDSSGVISKLRVEIKSTPYFDTSRPKIERYKNQLEWMENTLQEADEKLVSTSTIQTLVTQEKIGKLNREEESPSVTEIPSEDFKIMYRKRNKINSNLMLSKDSDQEDIITTKDTPVSSLVGHQTTLSPTTSTAS